MIGSDEENLKDFKLKMKKTLKMSDIRLMKFRWYESKAKQLMDLSILGKICSRSAKGSCGVFLSQQKYAQDLLEMFNMENCKLWL